MKSPANSPRRRATAPTRAERPGTAPARSNSTPARSNSTPVIGAVVGADDATLTAPTDSSSNGAGLLDPANGVHTRYTIWNEHARGGLGRVLRAHDSQLERDVAIKELLRKGTVAEVRFKREAMITARLEHPSIVPVHEYGRWKDGRPYYSMKMISGRTLKEVVDSCADLPERLALLPNVLSVVEAIAYAHSQGVIHRDLKPANVIVGAYGETVVVDWGIAKQIGQPDFDPASDDTAPAIGPVLVPADGCEGLTRKGSIVGTPSYMPPEQALGEPVDERADVYSLGAILYRVLSGVAPFDGESSLSVLHAVREGTPLPIDKREPGVPPEIAAIVRKAMARSVYDRYQSAEALAEDLKRYLAGQRVGAHDYSRRALVARFVRRHRAPVAVATAMTAVLIAGAAVAVTRIVAEKEVAQSEGARAVEAASRAKANADELILTNAESWLTRDPTTALAWVKNYPDDGADWSRARRIAIEAVDRGVAADVIQMNERAFEQIAWSPDGKWIATAGLDQTIALWNVEKRTLTRFSFDSATGEEVMRFSPDSKTLYFARWKQGIGVHDMVSGETSLLPGSESLTFNCLAVTRDGHYLGAGSWSGEVVVWNLPDGTSRMRKVHQTLVGNLEFADGPELLSRSYTEGSIWNLASDSVKLLTGHRGEWSTIRLSPDQRTVLTSSRGGQIKLWDRATGRLERTYEVPDAVYEVRYAPDTSNALAYSRGDNTVRRLHLDNGKHETLTQHIGALEQFAFHPNGVLMASIDYAGHITFWTAEEGIRAQLRQRDQEIHDLTFSPRGDQIATGGDGGRLYVWRVPAKHSFAVRTARAPLRARFSQAGHELAVRYDDASTSMFTVGRDRVSRRTLPSEYSPFAVILAAISDELFILDDPPQVVERWSTADSSAQMRRGERLLRSDLIVSARVSRDQRFMVTAESDRSLAIWDLSTAPKATQRTRHALHSAIESAAVSNDGKSAIALLSTGGVVVVDVERGTVRSIDGPPLGSPTAPVALADDGRSAVCAAAGGVALWDLDRGIYEVFQPGGHDVITRTQFLAGAHQPVMASNRGLLYRWDVGSNAWRATPIHDGEVNRVRAAPVGPLVATVGRDRVVRIIDTANDTIRTLSYAVAVDEIQWSSDARYLVALSGNAGTTRVWDVATMAPVPSAAAPRDEWLNQQSAVGVQTSLGGRALTSAFASSQQRN